MLTQINMATELGKQEFTKSFIQGRASRGAALQADVVARLTRGRMARSGEDGDNFFIRYLREIPVELSDC